MQKSSLTALGREQLELAQSSSSGRSASTVYGRHEHVLRQTVSLWPAAANSMTRPTWPGHCPHPFGRVTLHAGGNAWSGRTGALLVVPEMQHSLKALEDSVVLLTVGKIR